MEAFNQGRLYRLSPHALSLFESVSRKSGDRLRASLIRSIADLSQLFTKERDRISTRYLDDADLAAAYAAYFLPINFGKVQMLLNELPSDWADGDTLSVLDVGSGSGTASLAVLDWLACRDRLAPLALQVLAIDHSKAALLEASRMWNVYAAASFRGRASLMTSHEQVEALVRQASGIDRFTESRFDLIIVANCLNELFHESSDPEAQRETLLERLLAALKPAGTMIVLEPALRLTARALHQTRDRLLSRGLCTVYSPCLHEGSCPALAKVDDWCHEERSWESPSWIPALDRELGFIKDTLKFSYLILRKDGRTIVSRGSDIYRVVSELRVLKGEKRAWLCNEQGRSEIGRLDRRATSANADFDAWERGAIVQIDQIVRKARNGIESKLGRIVEDSAVQTVRKA